MLNIIVEVSKYLLLFLMIFFTAATFSALKRQSEEKRSTILGKQIVLMIVFNFVAYLVMFFQTENLYMIFLFLGATLYIVLINALYHACYPRGSMVLVNTMCMLLSIGFVIQARLGMDYAIKQMIIAGAASLISLLIPLIIKKARFLRKMGWFFGILGMVLLLGVLAFSTLSRGANLSITIAGISFQFSEFVKITIVFFMAAMLQEITTFKRVLAVTIVAGLHVVILVLSKDLGAALVYFVAYIVVVSTATRKIRYAFIGLAGMGLASVAAYKLFSHIRVRVNVWRDPFADYQGTGYQIVQALFGVCAGGWFGTGLFAGNPEMIPLAVEDFTFAAICEELGILFGICLILLCMGTFLIIVNMAMKLSDPFYKLIAMGLGTEYAFQVFLTIGGTTKLIPMTGITLPLVSYGGSSVVCTIFMLAIVQGLYILRKDEDQDFEKRPNGRGDRRPERQTDELGRKIEEETEKSLNW